MSQEVLSFVRLDVRNRIVRRFPFISLGAAARWLTRRPYDRRYSRTGLLEQYYSKYLYGATCLYELPARPELHLLATNLSEGCICSFTRSGLIMQRRLPGDRIQFERIQAGLASVPLAVAASSAFPAFFPPIRLRAADIGAARRPFHNRLSRTEACSTIWESGPFGSLNAAGPRIAVRPRQTAAKWRSNRSAGPRGSATRRPRGVPNQGMPVFRSHESWRTCPSATIARELSPPDGSLLGVPIKRGWRQRARCCSVPRVPSRARVRRAAFSRSAASRLLRGTSFTEFDAVLVSDAGAKLATHHDSHTGGLVRTAIRRVGHLDGPGLATREGDLWCNSRLPFRPHPSDRGIGAGSPYSPACHPAPGYRDQDRPRRLLAGRDPYLGPAWLLCDATGLPVASRSLWRWPAGW